MAKRDDLVCIIGQKLGGPEGKAVAAAIEKLALDAAEQAALAASPDFLDPLVSRLFDMVEPMIKDAVAKALDEIREAACKVRPVSDPTAAADYARKATEKAALDAERAAAKAAAP